MTEEHFTLLKLFGAVVIKDAVKDLTPIITAYDSAVFKKIGSDTPLNFVQGKIPACAFALEENSELRMLLLDAYSANFLSQSKNRLLYCGGQTCLLFAVARVGIEIKTVPYRSSRFYCT